MRAGTPGVPALDYLEKDGAMTAAVSSPERRSIRDQVRAAEERSRIAFRLKVAITWATLIGVILGGLWVTDNIDTAFISEWGPFIIGGAGLTVLISVVSISFATVFALLGAFGRLSANPYDQWIGFAVRLARREAPRSSSRSSSSTSRCHKLGSCCPPSRRGSSLSASTTAPT